MCMNLVFMFSYSLFCSLHNSGYPAIRYSTLAVMGSGDHAPLFEINNTDLMYEKYYRVIIQKMMIIVSLSKVVLRLQFQTSSH